MGTEKSFVEIKGHGWNHACSWLQDNESFIKKVSVLSSGRSYEEVTPKSEVGWPPSCNVKGHLRSLHLRSHVGGL